MIPQRVQRQRTKGWRKPENTVVVTRPGRWGNPYVVGTDVVNAVMAVSWYRLWLAEDPRAVSEKGKPPSTETIRAELRGKNLACWCGPGEPCHADVLIELANPVCEAC